MWFPGVPVGLSTAEGPAAIKELIKFLKVQKPLEPLGWVDNIAKASKDHTNDIGSKGFTSHDGTDGS